MEKKSRRKFSAAFKAKVVIEALRERSAIEQLAKKYELHPNQITNWKQEFLANAEAAFVSARESDASKSVVETEKLYAQIGQLKAENDWLKKAAVIPRSVRMAMVKPYKGISTSKQCELLGVCRSMLYHKPQREKAEDLKIMRLLDEQYFHTPFYGIRRIKQWLMRHGYDINWKRVAPLMKVVGWL